MAFVLGSALATVLFLLGPSMSMPPVPLKGAVRVARACLALACAVVIGTDAYWFSHGGSLAVFLTVAGALLVGGVLQFNRIERQVAQSAPWLTPGLMAMPEISLERIPEDAVIAFLGQNLVWSTAAPHTVLTMAGKPILEIGWDDKLRVIAVRRLQLFDDRGEIITTIKNGVIWVRSTNQFIRPDAHTLVVKDYHDDEVLCVTCLNARAVRITGVFRAPNRPPLVITPTEMRVGGITMSQMVIAQCAQGLLIQ